MSQSFSYPERLLLRDGGRMLCISVDEIAWIEAAGNYVQIHTPRRTHLVRHTVKAMEVKLDPAQFLRVRPSAIVHVGEVASLESRGGGDYLLTLRDGTQIATSRSFRDRVELAFGKPTRRRRTGEMSRPVAVEAVRVAPAPVVVPAPVFELAR